MSQYERRELSGILFKNTDKEPDNPAHEKWADYKGDAKIDGVDYWMNAWIKTAKNGSKFMGLNFKPKEAKPQAQAQPKLKVVGANTDPSDEVPF